MHTYLKIVFVYKVCSMDLSSFDGFRDSWVPFILAGVIGLITVIRTYIGGNECPSKNKIIGKVVLITGASGGLGLQTAKELAKRGAVIILTCRNLEKGRKAIKSIKRETPNAMVDIKELDVSNLHQIRQFVKNLNYEKIDILINNAGIMLHPYQLTSEGFEIHFATNYLGHFLLTHLLLEKLKISDNGRIINITSQGYSSGHINLNDINLKNLGDNNIIQAFSQSKLALVLMTRYISKLLQDTKVTINCADPGLVRNTNHMNRSPLKASIPVRLSVWPWMWLFLKTPKQGCQTIIYLALEPQLTNVNGKYFSNCEVKEFAENCKDTNVDKELYKLSCIMAKIKPLDN